MNAVTLGMPIRFTQLFRTIAEQVALNALGSIKLSFSVINAKGGTSYYDFGLAIDLAVLLPDGKQVSWDIKRDGDGGKVADWTEVVQEAKSFGFN
ncbi:M15 family metallopeptidase [Paenibacillus odorifer]|uniref:M15 family metallopeptidase n=2 Tax=Paenibacillus TaxID=44249 RepID=UPI00117ED768|nr:M15 family metallopeptidase [Paenibacillus odorifer]